VSCQKRKNVESIIQVFTFLQFEIANYHFHCKTITHMACCTLWGKKNCTLVRFAI